MFPTLSKVGYIPFMKNCLPVLSKNLLPTASMVGSLAATAVLPRAAAAARSEERMLTDMGCANRKRKLCPNFLTCFQALPVPQKNAIAKNPSFSQLKSKLGLRQVPKVKRYKLLLRVQVCGGIGRPAAAQLQAPEVAEPRYWQIVVVRGLPLSV